MRRRERETGRLARTGGGREPGVIQVANSRVPRVLLNRPKIRRIEQCRQIVTNEIVIGVAFFDYDADCPREVGGIIDVVLVK